MVLDDFSGFGFVFWILVLLDVAVDVILPVDRKMEGTKTKQMFEISWVFGICYYFIFEKLPKYGLRFWICVLWLGYCIEIEMVSTEKNN